ncbi:uncharacterized protein STEHIDRAFT_119531 [Stereum hirsutum FP-91666 SS1]|uniref:uncharacterized protein n=1 Tax=Stereum hirsutum (strain FP-91666) TaxID=721885 RepID=UPI000440D6AF|nr:uncharacterized protein STEHIDRAFT_119531 [Stereum hirsutum FP-91666 SS1]EIM88676.1 hypothetical protein STEHIDRAFT_119531 [Stereum hirsutum FP-91666 SS1]
MTELLVLRLSLESIMPTSRRPWSNSTLASSLELPLPLVQANRFYIYLRVPQAFP